MFLYRNGKPDSKKFWRNTACAIFSAIMVRLAWKLSTSDGMDDMAFVWLSLVYLLSVDGFDVLLEVVKAIRNIPSTPQPVIEEKLN